MRREAAQLVPGDDVLRCIGDEFLEIHSGKELMRDIAKADFMPIAEKTNAAGKLAANGGERFIRSSCGETVGLSEKFLFEGFSAALPLGDFQTSGQLWFS